MNKHLDLLLQSISGLSKRDQHWIFTQLTAQQKQRLAAASQPLPSDEKARSDTYLPDSTRKLSRLDPLLLALFFAQNQPVWKDHFLQETNLLDQVETAAKVLLSLKPAIKEMLHITLKQLIPVDINHHG